MKYFLSIVLFTNSLVVNSVHLHAQQTSTDSIIVKRRYHYFNITFLSGLSALFPIKTTGNMSARFSYTATNAAGFQSTNVFSSKTQQLDATGKYYFFPLAFEIGTAKTFVNGGISFLNSGYNISLGYGLISIFSLRKGHQNIKDNSFILKYGLNIQYATEDVRPMLGDLNNLNTKINVLGHTADSIFTLTYTLKGAGTHSTTYQAKTIEVNYHQNQFSILPRISIGNNPYKNGRPITSKVKTNAIHKSKLTWEFSIGYNIDIYNKGGISLSQNDGNGHSHYISKLVALNNSDLTVVYNSNRISKPPLNYSGLYISFVLNAGRCKIN